MVDRNVCFLSPPPISSTCILPDDDELRFDVFEVYKAGQISSKVIQDLTLEELRKRFTLLSPITSKEQVLTGDIALGALPAPGNLLSFV
jgi:hypothetical protein